ncbi:hypothetical protein ACRQ5Q_40640 [Bradyrhizobium sp. PMVTL-01]|uniref:hypothetical protein n=1 Tax=Bradyrhizobium sp. PMVTL-01 TaxID=3434999 RepID=UPI003F7258AB
MDDRRHRQYGRMRKLAGEADCLADRRHKGFASLLDKSLQPSPTLENRKMKDTYFLDYLEEQIRLSEYASEDAPYDEGYLTALREVLEDLTELDAIQRLRGA